jgi:serine/threonine protein kinase
VNARQPIALASTALRPSGVDTLAEVGSRGRKKRRESEIIEVGSIIGGRYQVVRFVAEGAFGAVYQALDLDVAGHVVALKLMHRPWENADQQELSQREVQLIVAVSHPSVVSFKDHGLHQGRFYIVMPWYEGETLSSRLRGGLGLTRVEALRIFRQLAQALSAVHERGIRHQDVKPENILLARFGEGQQDFPVLLDLGVGAFAHELVPAFTPAYVAPEMARAHVELAHGGVGTSVDGKADVFALALTLFDALAPETRDLDECNGSLVDLAARADHGVTLPKVKALHDLEGAFARWLAVDPARRPTAQQLVHELSILTRVEERRAELRRVALRVGPFLSAAVATCLVLGLQLRTERVNSRVKDAKLEQQAAEIDSAREVLGTTGNDDDWASALQRAEARATLEAKQVLAAQRAELERAQTKLAHDRAQLQRERERLAHEQATQQQQLQDVASERNQLLTRVQALENHEKSQVAETRAPRRTRRQLRPMLIDGLSETPRTPSQPLL